MKTYLSIVQYYPNGDICLFDCNCSPTAFAMKHINSTSFFDIQRCTDSRSNPSIEYIGSVGSTLAYEKYLKMKES